RDALGADGGLRVVVDADEVQVLLGDLLGGLLALQALLEEPLQSVPPDRPADGEADEALDAGRLLQPVLDLLVARAAAQEHALDVLAALALAGLLSEHLGVLAGVDALDLPDVDLAAEVLDLLDRPAHQLGAQLGVVAVGVAVDLVELALLRRHEQLEEELAVVV